MNDWPWGNLKPFHYRVIMIDPPWEWNAWSAKGQGRSPQAHYDTMTLDEIEALPVRYLANSVGCVLMLWCTGGLPSVPERMMKAWGFKFSSRGFCWVKNTLQSMRDEVVDIRDNRNWHMGNGYTTRKNVEDCWFGKIGQPVRLNKGVREPIISPKREYSRKPDEAYARAMTLYPGPYADVFSRESRPGWHTFGNEAGKFDVPHETPGAA